MARDLRSSRFGFAMRSGGHKSLGWRARAMFKSILLVLGEEGTKHASVDLALRWAEMADALLVGLGIVDTAAVHPVEAVPLGAGQAKRELDAARLTHERHDVENRLSALAVRCAQAHVAFKPLEHVGRPSVDILLEAQRFDLIVMPRHTQYFHTVTENGFGKALWEVLRAAPRPVIAVPDHATTGTSVVIAYDGSVQAARALQAFTASGLAANRCIHVVSLDQDPVEAARRGDRAIEFLASHSIEATLHPESDQPHTAEQLMEHAYRLDAGLLVMGAYGQPRVCEFVLGSVTRALLSNCTIPLFLYH